MLRHFLKSERSTTLLDFGNDILDAITEDIKPYDADELSKIEKVIKTELGETFSHIISEIIKNSIPAHDSKLLILKSASESEITYAKAIQCMLKIYSEIKDETLQLYFMFILSDVPSIILSAEEKFKFLNISETTFYSYVLSSYVPKLIQKKHLKLSSELGKNFSLFSLMFVGDSDMQISVIDLHTELPMEEINTFDEVIEYITEHNRPMKGNENEIIKAMKFMNSIGPVWNDMSASISIRNEPVTNTTSMSGGRIPNESELREVFSGNYFVVPDDEPESDISLSLITNYNAFNQLSENKKRKVSHYLKAHRGRFNSVLESHSKTLMNYLNNFTPETVSSELKSNIDKLIPQYSSTVGLNNSTSVNSNIISDTINFASKIQSEYKEWGSLMKAKKINGVSRTMRDAIEFLSQKFIPMTTQFESKCRAKYGDRNCDIMFSGFSRIPSVSFIGNSNKKFNASMSGGSQQSKTKYIYSNEDDDLEISEEPRLEGAASNSESLLNEFISEQKKYNVAYEKLYRDLTRAIDGIIIENTNSINVNKLFTLCRSLEGIAIKSPETTVSLSGFYG